MLFPPRCRAKRTIQRRVEPSLTSSQISTGAWEVGPPTRPSVGSSRGVAERSRSAGGRVGVGADPGDVGGDVVRGGRGDTSDLGGRRVGLLGGWGIDAPADSPPLR